MLIADGGGSVRVPVNVPNPVNTAQQPASSAESDAAARARELQRQLEALLEKLREAQRQAEEARKRAIEAQRKAQEARKHAEAMEAQAQKSKDLADANKAKKAQQDAKLGDARAKDASADANLKDKNAELLKAEVKQKREEVKSPDAKASAATDKKVQDAKAEHSDAKETRHLSKLYLDAQEKESKAQDAEAKVAELTPTPGRPSATITDKESTALSKAEEKAKTLRGEADAATKKFGSEIGEEANTEFWGNPPAPAGTEGPPAPAADDPLQTPLTQLLQVSPKATTNPAASNGLLFTPTLTSGNTGTTGSSLLVPPSTISSGTGTNATSPFNTFLKSPEPVVTPQVKKTLTDIADGKSVEQIASDRKMRVDQVMSEANAAGVKITTAAPKDGVQATTIQRGDASLTYSRDAKQDTLSVKGNITDPKAPGGQKAIDAKEDGNGRYSLVTKDAKTGDTTTTTFDISAGTRTVSVVDEHGLRTDTTTSLTGAEVTRPVGNYEGYREVAKAADLTLEQLLALNPDVDYGKALKPGQEMVVAGVPTTVKTFNKDGSALEKTIASDGTLQVVATSADGRRTVLMGEPDARNGPGEAARKSIFDDKKSVADTAKKLGMTEAEVLAALPEGTVDVRKPTTDNGDVEIRTLYDPSTNRVVVETTDWQHGDVSRKDIGEKAKFTVTQKDPKTDKSEKVEVEGGVGYLQNEAENKAAQADGYGREISDLDKDIRLYKRMGEPVADLVEQRKQLVSQQKDARGEAKIAESKATAAFTRRQQVLVDEDARVAYQNLAYARPGSKDQAEAAKVLDDQLERLDHIDRLVDAADKEVDLAKADLDKAQKQDDKAQADADLQTEFQKWKRTWLWNGLDEKEIQKREAEGATPVGHSYRNDEEENKAAWKAFVQQQEMMDEHGDKYLTDAGRPARDAWLNRNKASDAALDSGIRCDKASIASTTANGHVAKGEVDRLQYKKDLWVDANPNSFKESFAQQDKLDNATDRLAKSKIGVLQDGENKKYTEFLAKSPVSEREDPEGLKKLQQQYNNDNEESAEKISQQIQDLKLGRTRQQAKSAEAFIAQWAARNPELQRQIEAFDARPTPGSVRAAEARIQEKEDLLASSEQGRQLQKAKSIKIRTENELTQLSRDDEERVQKDYDTSKKAQEGHTWLRDIFDDSADESLDYTKDQLDAVKRLKDKLASGEISLTEYVDQEDELMDAYGLKAVDLTREARENDEYWSVVDEAARIGTSTLAGIGATILSGGNVAAGIAVGFAVSELWDTTGDVVAAAQGRNIQADGHTSLFTFGYKAATGDVTWDDAKFMFKDEVVDLASAAVTPTGVGAGMRTSAALTAKFAAKEGVQLGANTTLRFTNRVAIGTRAGLKSQVVDGVGRVGVDTLHVGLDGQLASEEGNKRIGAAIVSSAAGLLTAPITGGLSGAAPLPNAMKGMAAKAKFGGAVTAQFANDAAGSWGTGHLISLANNGRLMNDGETTAAWIQAFPGTVNNIALHPHMARKIAAAAAAAEQQQQQQRQNAGNPANAVNAAANAANVGDAGNPAVPVAGVTQVHAPQNPGGGTGGTGGAPRPINVKTDHLPGLAGRDVDHLVVVNATSRDLATGLDTHTRAAEALAPGGVVEFHVALDTQKVVASAADPKAPGSGGKVKAGKDGADEGGVTRKGDEAQQQKEHQAAQDNAIRARLRGVGLENVRITRNANPGAGRPEIVVQASKPAMARAPESVFAKPAYDGYDQRMSYLRGDEMVGIYGAGTRPDPVALDAARNEARAARRDMRAGLTVRNRLNVNEAQPWLASPTMQSVSTGIGTRTNFREIARGAYYSFQLRSTAPLKNALGKELSVAVRPDEYRRTSMLQWGVLPFSRDTILTVFAKDLIGIAKKEMFGEGTPGYGVNMRSAKVIGAAADGSGQVVEVTLSVKLDGEHVTLAEGQKDFLGGKAGNTPGDHVKVSSSLLFDRVIEDRRFAPFIPALKKITGYNGVFSASVERRWQMLLKDVIGKDDVVPARFFEQFQKTFADAKYKMQVVVPHADAAKLYDATAIDVRDFVARPNVPAFKDLVAKGHVDPGKALVFVPERGGNHHRTAVPGKPVQNELVDLTGKLRRVPHESTSNVWVIFADNKLERGFERGMYRVKNFAYKMLPESAQRSQPSPHHVAGRGNLIDGMTGGRGRPDANGSLRLTAVFPVPRVIHAGLLAGSTEFRLQMGMDAPGESRSVAKGGASSVRVSPDGTAAVDVPNWFPRLVEQSLTGSIPLVPTGGTKQLGKFFDDLQTVLSPEQRATVAALREKHMGGDKPTIGDAKFLRADVAQDIVDVLTGLQPGNGRKPQALVAGQRPDEAVPVTSAAATRPSGLRRADLNYVDGEVTVKGRPVQASDIELAVPADSILIIANRANPPSAERIAADVRAAGHPEGKDVVIYLCDAGTPTRPDAPVPASLARDVSNKLGARVHAVDGDVVLGEHVALGGSAVTQRPNLPLTDVSQNGPHRTADANLDAQKRFWLEPGGRTQEAEAPFAQNVLDKGAWVGDKTIDPLHLGIEERAVELVPFDAQHARDVLPYLAKELKYSPDYMRLKADGMTEKWVAEIEAGTRMAFVIYPAPGSAAQRRPLGIIAVHKEPLIGDNYLGTRDSADYKGEAPAGRLGRQELLDRGEVWQFSTYLSADRASSRNRKSPFPGGVVNSAAKKQVMDLAVAELARRGEPIDAFYARVHAGAPEAVPALGWPETVNAKSLVSQERMAGGGPLAVVHEKGPHAPGETAPTRYVAIFETPASRYAEDGPGTAAYRSLIDTQIGNDPRSHRWLGPQEWQGQPLVHRPADLSYLEGNATVNGRPVPARDIEVAVPEKAFLVMADEANVPGAERLAADMRAAGYADGQEVALYICRAGKIADPAAPVPESLALELGDKLGARVHAMEGTIKLGEKIELGEGDFVSAQPKLPLMDVSTGRPHANENFDAQKRYWLAPNGRGERVDAPLGAEVRNMGARVGDNWIDPFVLGIEDRVVRLEQFSDRNAPAVLPSLTKQLAVSPDFKNLGPEGMARKWQQEMEAGTRMAYVVYPAEGSPLGQKPLGIIALHREALVDSKYVKTLPASYYRDGKFPAGEVSREELVARGDVWQFSTYLNADAKQVPGTNKAGKMLTIEEAAAEGKRRGEEVLAFYARVHGGGPLVLMEPHVNANIPSLFGQESMARRGPIAVGLEQGSPVTGGADRYVLIFETDRGLYLPDGAGRKKWTADIQKLIDSHPDPASWLGAAQDIGPSGPAASHAASRDATAKVTPGRGASAIDPDSVARQSYDALANELGLTATQADAMRGWTVAHRDAVTGFYDARLSSLKADTVARAQEHVAQSGDEAHYVSADIGNLGGLNAAMNNVAEAANVHFRGLADILSTRLGATDATVVPMRTGGDELGVVVVGIDEPTLANAVEATQRQVSRYAEDHGLADIPHPKHADQAGVGLHIGYTSVSSDKTLDHIFTEADQGVDRSKQHVTTDEGRTAGTDRPEPGATKATPAATAEGSGRGAPAREDRAGGPARGAPESGQPEVLTPAHPTRFATGSHDHAKIDPDAVRLQEFSDAARAAGLDTRQFTGLLHYANAAKDSVTGFYDARQSGVKADTVLRLQDLVAGSDDNGFYVSADIANLGGLNHAMGNVAERANVHFKAMATLFADELAATGATVIPLRTGGDELSAAVVGQIDEAGLRAALGAADQRIARYAQEQGLADIPHPKRKGEKGVGMHMGYAEAMPGRTLDRIFTEADMGVDASKNAAQHPRIDFEDGQPVALRTSDGDPISAHRLTMIESDGTRRPMTGAEVVAMVGPQIGVGGNGTVYEFGAGQAIKILRTDSDIRDGRFSMALDELQVDLPDGATIHSSMKRAVEEVAALRKLADAAGAENVIDVKGPYLVGNRLVTVMPRYEESSTAMRATATRTLTGPGTDLLNERTATGVATISEGLHRAGKDPWDPQFMVDSTGRPVLHDPAGVHEGLTPSDLFNNVVTRMARTGRQNAALRAAPETADKALFALGPAPDEVGRMGGLKLPAGSGETPGGLYPTVAAAKWAAMQDVPPPDGSPAKPVPHIYTVDAGKARDALAARPAPDGTRAIPGDALIAARTIDRFGRFAASTDMRPGAPIDIDWEGRPVTMRDADTGAELPVRRLMVREADGTRRPMTGAEVVAMTGQDMLGRGSSADVYPFGEGQVIKIFRQTRAPDPDQSHLLVDLPDGATLHPRMAAAVGEVAAVRELREAAGGSGFVDVKGPFLVGDRLALVMPRHPFAGKRLELDLEMRTYSGEGSELLNERTARTAGVLTDRLNAADKFPGDPQHLVEQDGSVTGFDPLEVSSGELAQNYHEGQALKLARTGRHNAAQRPAPETPNAGRVQFVVGSSPERVIAAGGLEIPAPDGVHTTVAGAKWAAIEPMPAPFDRDGSEEAAYVYTTDRDSVQVAADGMHAIPLEAILSGRQVDAFGRFVPDQNVRFRATGGTAGRQIPEGLIDLSKLGQRKDGPDRGAST